ncbi:hypothetical protein EBH_0019850 [Eimeria brunetti]|uniref:Uncharacterized protein n=1 Tax=Eimeria brunetti TaxID=51314 RepID=U6LCV9_9EIME|nr:hypothetical protein EBH_0019850 [Eimeria brunetti]
MHLRKGRIIGVETHQERDENRTPDCESESELGGCVEETPILSTEKHAAVIQGSCLVQSKMAPYNDPKTPIDSPLRTCANGRWCELIVVRTVAEHPKGSRTTAVRSKTPAEQAYEVLADQVADMPSEKAATLLLLSPKRYKLHTKAKEKVKIDSLVQQAVHNSKTPMEPMQGLDLIVDLHASVSPTLALAEVGETEACRLTNDRQGALGCALIKHANSLTRQGSSQTPATPLTEDEDEPSPWPEAKLEYTHFDQWLDSDGMRDTPLEKVEVLRVHREVFQGSLPTGLPPRSGHMTIVYYWYRENYLQSLPYTA